MADRAAWTQLHKLDWSMLPTEALRLVLMVLTYGRVKYNKDNWRTPPYFTRSDILNSIDRHMVEIKEGRLLDDETGLPHTAHIACNALFATYYDYYNLWDEEDYFCPPSDTTFDTSLFLQKLEQKMQEKNSAVANPVSNSGRVGNC